MGDRISIQFENGRQKSIALFSHWDGVGLCDSVEEYYAGLIKDYPQDIQRNIQTPINSFEPCVIMVDFIRWKFKDVSRLRETFYLGKDENDGDNGDNGNYVFDLKTGKFKGSV